VQRRGKDNYGYDPDSHQVTSGADGIPELTLNSLPRSGDLRNVNLQLLDVGTAFDAEKLGRQIATGWIADDLAAWQGELRLSTSASVALTSTPSLQSAERDALEAILGEPRIALLYSIAQPIRSAREMRAICVELVAIRVVAVCDASDGAAEIVVQPTVMTTRTALTDSEADENGYIHRLTLTR
jgi:hypothetical protein